MDKYAQLIGGLYARTVEYARLQAKVTKMQMFERVTSMLASSASWLFMGVLIIFTLLFASAAAAFWVGKVLDSYITGFAVVSLFYLVVSLVYALLKEKVVVKPLRNSILLKISHVHHDYPQLQQEIESLNRQTGLSEIALKKQFEELKRILEELSADIQRVKTRFTGETNEEGTKVGGKIPRIAITSVLEFLLSNVLFPKAGLLKKILLPVVANTLVTSAVFKEKKKTSLLENLKLKFSKFLTA